MIAGGLAAGLSFIGALAAGRLLFEWLLPELSWLGRPLPGLLVAGLLAVVGWLLWRLLAQSLVGGSLANNSWADNGKMTASWSALSPFLPLALNLAYLFDPAVDLRFSRFLFLATFWLAAVFLAQLLAQPATWRWLAYALLIAFLLPVYLATMGRTVGTADAFEFQVVVPRLGIVHPTGYPLYLLLAKPFTWLPLNDVAWRVNLATLLFGLIAVCLLYTLGRRLTGWRVPALLSALLFGLTPTFWSQSIEAEVYALHALIVTAALLLMREIGDWRLVTTAQWSAVDEQLPGQGSHQRPALHPYTATVLLALVLGLGLTNHLTTVILLPAAALTLFFAYRAGRFQGARLTGVWSIVAIVAAFCLPLLLYAYLPIRWAAVNGEAMGLDRFVDWVIGGRFQGALQLNAWLKDGARYGIVGRLVIHEWPVVWGLPLIVIGLGYLFVRQWRYALLLSITWLGYIFYTLNYYVPDLAVFLIPTTLIMALLWAVGALASMAFIARLMPPGGTRFILPLQALAILIAVTPALLAAGRQTWPAVDRSADDGRVRWGRSVLDLPIASGAAILADSDKFPPLYYLQQAEGLRPDLDIAVLPDEGAYRAELDARLAAGQPVYLARFLPGLESIYHLRSLGPLTEVGLTPVTTPPAAAEPLELSFATIQLLAYQLAPSSPFAEGESAVTLFWQTTEPLNEVLHVYTRWAGETEAGPASSQHPAGNTYPTVAWSSGEIVADFHTLPQPALADSSTWAMQVAVAPPFTPADELNWLTVTTADWPVAAPAGAAELLRAQLGPISLDGVAMSEPGRRETPLVVQLSGYAGAPESLLLAITPAGSDPGQAGWQIVNPMRAPADPAQVDEKRSFIWTAQLEADLPAGQYDLLVAYGGQKASCGWLARRTDSCVVGQVTLSSGALPPGAVNFEDKIAMLAIDLADKTLRPGGELPLTLSWQALAPMSENYTVFIQVLDENDRIVGQVDAWPLQGTYPTGQWPAGEIIEDPYLVRLADDLPPGRYKLFIGWYLLESLRRLPVVDQNGLAVDDKVVVPGLAAPE